MSRKPQVAVNYWPSRFMRPQAVAEFATELEAAQVDWFQTCSS